MQKPLNSQYRLRKTIGILGIALPVIIFLVHQGLLSSISHYYYTSASIFFIGILFTFGLILISYKGYPMDREKNEKISDDWITTLAGISILITVLIPTTCTGSGYDLLFCDQGYLFGHNNSTKGTIHLLSAGIFLFSLGLMCYKQFPRNRDRSMRVRNSIYRICGLVVWICIGLLILIYASEKILHNDFNDIVFGFTFILETVAIWAFGTAWMIKGKIDKDVGDLKSIIFRKNRLKS